MGGSGNNMQPQDKKAASVKKNRNRTGEKILAVKTPIHRNWNGVYRYTCLVIWIVSSAVMIVDRFYWNVWPRQTICSPSCGNDFFCSIDEAFDVIARISARIIISTTSLVFITMCHGTFNLVSEVRFLEAFLYSWRQDNVWLHEIGGWVMGFWTVLHVWSLFLPSVFHGFKNVVRGGEWGYPLQVSLAAKQIDSELKQAAWGYDDIWRIVWMTVIFAVLIPLSRSLWALQRNFTLSMWLHVLAGFGIFFDSWRRKSHPHVWILNTPVFLWWLFDRIACTTYHRVNPCAEAMRIVLDKDYLLLLWKDDSQPKRICDVYWIKRGYDPSDPQRSGKHARFTGELSHPFTTCSSHDEETMQPAMEPPIEADVHWEGHRFSLIRALSRRVSLKAVFMGSRADADQDSAASASIAQSGRQGTKRDFGTHGGGARYTGVTLSRQHMAGLIGCDEDCKKEEEDGGTMIGVDVKGDSTEDLTVVYRNANSSVVGAGGLSTVPEMEEVSFADDVKKEGMKPCLEQVEEEDMEESMEEGHGGSNLEGTGGRTSTGDTIDVLEESEGPTPGVTPIAPSSQDKEEGSVASSNAVLMRMPTGKFQEHRRREREQGKGGALPGNWSKMAIVRVHRSRHPTIECSCLGVTHMLKCFRQSETSSIADLEASPETNSIPLKTHGPYRSEYGRLCEFPKLPPLLVVATGAGAGLVLDFVAYVRSRKLVPARPAKVVYSTASLPLLQFVTDSLLAERIPGLDIKTALTRHEDLQLYNATSGSEQELAMGRVEVESVIASVSRDTEVYFCGGGALNALLRKRCASRGLRYVGSTVQ